MSRKNPKGIEIANHPEEDEIRNDAADRALYGDYQHEPRETDGDMTSPAPDADGYEPAAETATIEGDTPMSQSKKSKARKVKTVKGKTAKATKRIVAKGKPAATRRRAAAATSTNGHTNGNGNGKLPVGLRTAALRVTDKELEGYHNAAGKRGMTQWAREILNREAGITVS